MGWMDGGREERGETKKCLADNLRVQLCIRGVWGWRGVRQEEEEEEKGERAAGGAGQRKEEQMHCGGRGGGGPTAIVHVLL